MTTADKVIKTKAISGFCVKHFNQRDTLRSRGIRSNPQNRFTSGSSQI
jgi:hypothetical protein